MDVRIYQPAKSAMQSGRGKSKQWVLEYPPATPRRNDALMGWVGSEDTQRQVILRFDSRDDAVSYAKDHGLRYRVIEPKARTVKPKTYADNFRFDKVS